LRLDFAGNLAAALDLDLVVVDLGRDLAAGMDQKAAAGAEITFQTPANLGILDRGGAGEETALGDIDVAAAGDIGLHRSLDDETVARLDLAGEYDAAAHHELADRGLRRLRRLGGGLIRRDRRRATQRLERTRHNTRSPSSGRCGPTVRHSTPFMRPRPRQIWYAAFVALESAMPAAPLRRNIARHRASSRKEAGGSMTLAGARVSRGGSASSRSCGQRAQLDPVARSARQTRAAARLPAIWMEFQPQPV